MASLLQSIIQSQQPVTTQPNQSQAMQTPQATFQNNFNQLQKIISAAQAVQNPVAYLQSQFQNHPLIKQALELGQKYNGDYDAATAELIKNNNLNPNEVKQALQQLGIK